MSNQAWWIVVEGVDGVGKSTLCANLAKLTPLFGESKVLHFPDESQHSTYKVAHISVDDGANLFMHATEMIDRYHHEIIPALQRGETRICDRFMLSNHAYNIGQYHSGWQGWLREAGQIKVLPDVVVVLDAPYRTAAERNESFELSYKRYNEVRRAYRTFAGICDIANHLMFLDAQRSSYEVATDMIKMMIEKNQLPEESLDQAIEILRA